MQSNHQKESFNRTLKNRIIGTLITVWISLSFHAQVSSFQECRIFNTGASDISISSLDLELNNIDASVVHNQNAPLLFGQSTLGKFVKITIDK